MFNDLALDQTLIRQELVAVPWVRFGGGSDDLLPKKNKKKHLALEFIELVPS